MLWPVAFSRCLHPLFADLCLPFLLPQPARVTSKELLLPDLHPCQSSATICPENGWLKVGEGRPHMSLKYRGESQCWVPKNQGEGSIWNYLFSWLKAFIVFPGMHLKQGQWWEGNTREIRWMTQIF